MYAALLEGIFKRNNLADETALANHLRGLQPYARNLWSSYRTQDVVVDYAHPRTQEAYLLRYFPFYCDPLTNEMDLLYERGLQLPRAERIDAVFFGCGPGPEIVGLMQHLANVDAPTTVISAQMIDGAAETWAYARDLVLQHLTAPCWAPRRVDYIPTQACLTDEDALVSAGIDGCHFAVVQNCLNEIPQHLRERVVVNVMSQFARLAPGAIALVIDRSGYPATDQMMRHMHALAEKHDNIIPVGEEEPQRRRISYKSSLKYIPDIVTNNLLYRSGDVPPNDWETNGLIISRNIDYVSMAFQIGV